MSIRQSNQLIISQKLRMNAGLTTAIQILRFDTTGLTRYLEEQAAENPYLALKPAALQSADWAPRWVGAFYASQNGAPELDPAAFTQSPAPGLMAHVTGQIRRLLPPGRSREIAGVLMVALDPSGWLTLPLSDLAREARASLDELETVLARLQQMEPTGLFARSLAECLRLQAAEAGYLDPIMEVILTNLDLLAKGETARLARICEVSEAEIILRLRRIRSFDPKPGSQFGQGAAPVREPDLLATKTDDGWQITLNRSALPDVMVLAPEVGTDDPQAPSKIGAAKAVQRMVGNRNQTLLNIAAELFGRQSKMLDYGMEHLTPMTQSDIAVALGFHESTISRAIAGVSIDTPRGVFWLRALFGTALGGNDGQSAAAIRAKLLRLIAAENPSQPLSDQALSVALSADAAPLARRTVAKYRAMLQIPPAHSRKRILPAPDTAK